MRERFERMADELGMSEDVDMQELMYNDPDRADVAEWLGGHGWRTQRRDVPRRDSVGSVASSSWLNDRDLFATFVTAEKH